MSTIISHSCELPGGIYPTCEAGHWESCKVLGAGQRWSLKRMAWGKKEHWWRRLPSVGLNDNQEAQREELSDGLRLTSSESSLPKTKGRNQWQQAQGKEIGNARKQAQTSSLKAATNYINVDRSQSKWMTLPWTQSIKQKVTLWAPW